jgi:hypothetical protein
MLTLTSFRKLLGKISPTLVQKEGRKLRSKAVDMICILHHHLLIQIDVLDGMPDCNNAIHDCLGKPVLNQTGHSKITEYF